MKKTVLDADDVKQLVPKLKNDKFINAVLRWLKVTDVNYLHSHNCHMTGADFTDGILKDLDILLTKIIVEHLQDLTYILAT